MDAVIAYVNCNDEKWRKNYENTFHSPYDKNRFRDLGTIELCIDSIRFYAPFIKNIFLVVQNESEIKFDVSKWDVKVVTHDQFIPKRFLPTFNSCTIETFFHNIEELDEKFLYFNDDIFLTNPVSEKDFFINGLPVYNLKAYRIEKLKQIFNNDTLTHHCICSNSFNIITNSKNLCYYTSRHVPYSYLKSYNKLVYNKHRTEIEKRITNKRSTMNTNIMLYITSAIKDKIGTDIPRRVLYLKTTDSPNIIKSRIIESPYYCCCINDVGDPSISDQEFSRIIKEAYITKKHSGF